MELYCLANSVSDYPHGGVELVDANSQVTKPLRQTVFGSAAKCDAVDPGLQEVIAAWDRLPAAIQDAIGVLVGAAKAQ
jgi:hypothetical protein